MFITHGAHVWIARGDDFAGIDAGRQTEVRDRTGGGRGGAVAFRFNWQQSQFGRVILGGVLDVKRFERQVVIQIGFHGRQIIVECGQRSFRIRDFHQLVTNGLGLAGQYDGCGIRGLIDGDVGDQCRREVVSEFQFLFEVFFSEL